MLKGYGMSRRVSPDLASISWCDDIMEWEEKLTPMLLREYSSTDHVNTLCLFNTGDVIIGGQGLNECILVLLRCKSDASLPCLAISSDIGLCLEKWSRRICSDAEDDELQCRGSFSRAAACCLPRRTEENPPLTKRIDIGGLKL